MPARAADSDQQRRGRPLREVEGVPRGLCWVVREDDRPAVEHPEVVRSTGRVTVACSEFAGFRFQPEVITLAVRWYLRAR